jgi:hypothetical protein
MIRSIAREVGIDEEAECSSMMKCKTNELSKKSASVFIQHLLDMQKQSDAASMPMRRAS